MTVHVNSFISNDEHVDQTDERFNSCFILTCYLVGFDASVAAPDALVLAASHLVLIGLSCC